MLSQESDDVQDAATNQRSVIAAMRTNGFTNATAISVVAIGRWTMGRLV